MKKNVFEFKKLPSFRILVDAPEYIYPRYPEEGERHHWMGRLIDSGAFYQSTTSRRRPVESSQFSVTEITVGYNFGVFQRGFAFWKSSFHMCDFNDGNANAEVYSHNDFVVTEKAPAKLPLFFETATAPVRGTSYKGLMCTLGKWDERPTFEKTGKVVHVETILDGRVFKLTSENGTDFICYVKPRWTPHPICMEYTD